MARLRKCKSCGNMVARDAKRCPQCGGKVNQSHGCLMIIILMIIVFIGICTSGEKDKTETETTKSIKLENDTRKDGAVAFVHDFLANECFPSTITDEKFEIKFYDNVKAEYLKNIAREGIDEKLLEFAREKGKTEMNNWIVVTQEFSLSLSPDTKMNYLAIVEFIDEENYKMKSMSINGKLVFP